MPHGRPTTTKEDKIAWLLAHSGLWEGLPQLWKDCLSDPEQMSRIRELRRQVGRLYSPRTNQRDVEYSLFWLVQHARKVRRQGGEA